MSYRPNQLGEKYQHTAHQNASHFVPQNLEEITQTLHTSVRRNDRHAVIRDLQMLIPEYKPIADEKKKALTLATNPQKSVKEPLPSANGI